MKHLKLFETFSNYTLDKMPEGFHKGSIKGYQVYMDDIDSGFKATTGLRNSFPLPCHVYIKDGSGVAFYKSGVLFSDYETEKSWKKEFGELENDKRFLKAKEELK